MSPATPPPRGTRLRRIVAVARVNSYFRHFCFDTNLVPFSGCSRIDGLKSDQVLVADSLTRFDNGGFRLRIVVRTEVKSTGPICKFFEQVGPLALLSSIPWFPGHAWTEGDCIG
jgi:hypothetical protein